MRFYVKCYECGRVFRINVQKYGRTRYRCPDCGNVVGFTLLQPAEKNGIALPVVEGHVKDVHPQRLSKGLKTSLQPSQGERELSKRLNDQAPKRPGFWRRLWHAFCWVFALIVRFLKWCNRKIRTFRERYEDADLWLFFGFSFLFVVGVIVGLWLMAQITILLSDVHSWFFQMFLKLKFML